MITTAPHHLENRLRDAHAKLQDIATLRGLEHAFAMELFSLSLTVEEALESGSRGLLKHALEDVQRLEDHLRSTPAKASPVPASVKIGR